MKLPHIFTEKSLLATFKDGKTLFRLIIEKGELESIPNKFLTKEILLKEDQLGSSLLQIIAESGQLNKLPQKTLNLLSSENLRLPTKNTETTLHKLAEHGFYHQLSPHIINDIENLQTTSMGGIRVIHLIAKSGQLHLIKKGLLTKELLYSHTKEGWNVAHYAANWKHIEQIPPNLMTEELLLKYSNTKTTPLHLIAYNKQLDKIPKSLITKLTLTLTDHESITVAHMAALGQSLKQIDKKLLCPEILLKQDKDLNSVLHIAAQAKCLNQIPFENFSPKEIQSLRELKNNHGQTIAHKAFKHNCVEQLPPSLLAESPELINQTDIFGETPLDLSIEHHCLENCLKMIPIKALKWLTNNDTSYDEKTKEVVMKILKVQKAEQFKQKIQSLKEIETPFHNSII